MRIEITLERISKRYTSFPFYASQGVIALREVSYRFEEGRTYGILGPNGAGKSTLFKSIIGLVKPTSGTILLTGKTPANPASRNNLSYIPENFTLPWFLTPRSALNFVGEIRGLQDYRTQAERALASVGLLAQGAKSIRQLSKGMRQRIAIAQLLLGDPDILILDEPFEGLDVEGRMFLKECLDKFRKRGALILISTHNFSELIDLCDIVAVLNRGVFHTETDVGKLLRSDAYILFPKQEIPAQMKSRFILRELRHQPNAKIIDEKEYLGIKSDPIHRFDQLFDTKRATDYAEHYYLTFLKEGGTSD
jgi:ABC-2 type transport system ATP-binding protein